MKDFSLVINVDENKKTTGFGLITSIKKESKKFVKDLVHKIINDEAFVEVEGNRIKFRDSKTKDYIIGFELTVLELDPLKALIKKPRLIVSQTGIWKKRYDFIYV